MAQFGSHNRINHITEMWAESKGEGHGATIALQVSLNTTARKL